MNNTSRKNRFLPTAMAAALLSSTGVPAAVSIHRDADAGTALPNPIPRGLPVATVNSVASPTDQIFKEIVAEPLASLAYNQTVFVVAPPGSAQGER